jgi:hypothetical protein
VHFEALVDTGNPSPQVSSQKLEVEKTDHPDKPRSEAPSLPDNQWLPQDIEKIPPQHKKEEAPIRVNEAAKADSPVQREQTALLFGNSRTAKSDNTSVEKIIV